MKNRGYLGALFVAVLMLYGCFESDTDKDGVPKVDLHGHVIVKKEAEVTVKVNASDPTVYRNQEYRVVTVKGKDMSLSAFINTYCLGKETTNETCVRAAKINDFDAENRFTSLNGKLAPLPSGL